jgi:hypothetical protein
MGERPIPGPLAHATPQRDCLPIAAPEAIAWIEIGCGSVDVSCAMLTLLESPRPVVLD